jgi:hypothetical protein
MLKIMPTNVYYDTVDILDSRIEFITADLKLLQCVVSVGACAV